MSGIKYHHFPHFRPLSQLIDMSFSFEDVVPVSLNDSEPQVCQILYNEEYKLTMGILLALMKQGEYSERALYITEKGIELLASHYTIWVYRYRILRELKKDLIAELDWCEQIALEHEKNYQIWNYRQLIIGEIVSRGDKFEAHREYPIINAMLESDTKNHHVWSYRKWLVEKFELFDNVKETQFIDNCLLLDLRNNSAWTHRFFVKFGGKVDDKVIGSELEYTKALIRQSPQNPSSWNYLIGIYEKFDRKFGDLKDFCLEFASLDSTVTSSFALELLARIYVEQEKYDESIKVYGALAEKYDPIRRNYWKYQTQKVKRSEGIV